MAPRYQPPIQGGPVQRADLFELGHNFLRFKIDLLDAFKPHMQEANARVVLFDNRPHLVPANICGILKDSRLDERRTIGADGLATYCNESDLLLAPPGRFVSPCQTMYRSQRRYGLAKDKVDSMSKLKESMPVDVAVVSLSQKANHRKSAPVEQKSAQAVAELAI